MLRFLKAQNLQLLFFSKLYEYERLANIAKSIFRGTRPVSLIDFNNTCYINRKSINLTMFAAGAELQVGYMPNCIQAM
jgi:hypothetical protein